MIATGASDGMYIRYHVGVTLQRKRLLLVGAFVVALAITLFFGVRFVTRIRNRPTRDPIRAWQDMGYISHAYGVPPRVLEEALGLKQGPPPDRRPIGEIAASQNKTTDEVIRVLETAIARDRPPPPARGSPPGQPRVTVTPNK